MSVYHFGDYRFDPERWILQGPECSVEVRRKAAQLLAHLLDHPGILVPKDDLFRAVWPNTAVTDNTLMQTVQEVRRLLGDNPRRPRFIKTFPRRGYQWVGPAVELTSGSVSSPVETEKDPKKLDDGHGRRRSIGITTMGLLAGVAAVLGYVYKTSQTPAVQAFGEGERALATVGPTVAREHFAEALELDPSMTRARVALALTLELTGDWSRSLELYQQALEQSKEAQLRLATLRGLAGLAILRMHLNEAEAFLRQASRLVEATADLGAQPWILRGLLLVHGLSGRPGRPRGRCRDGPRARASEAAATSRFHSPTDTVSLLGSRSCLAVPTKLRTVLSRYREAGDLGNQAVVLHQLANRPELSTAERRQLHEEALRLFHEIGHRRGIARTLADIGFLDVMELDEVKATESLEASA